MVKWETLSLEEYWRSELPVPGVTCELSVVYELGATEKMESGDIFKAFVHSAFIFSEFARRGTAQKRCTR